MISSGNYPVVYMAAHPEQQIPSKPKKHSFEIKETMDLCNLYIKGLQPGMTSEELFNLFQPFGRIISARVMEQDKNSITKAGFGFVSFSQSLEAAKALIELYVAEPPAANKKNSSRGNGFVMAVRFHEPRVPRPEHNFSQQLALLSSSPLGCHFYTRENNKIVPLQTMQEQQGDSLYSASSYATVASLSLLPSFFPANTTKITIKNSSTMDVCPLSCYYYYPRSYWRDQQGVVYAAAVKFISSSSPPTSSQMYVVPIQQESNEQQTPKTDNNQNKKHQQHRRYSSWSAKNTEVSPTPPATDISEKLVEILRSNYHVSVKKDANLVKKVMGLSQTENATV